MDPELQQKIDEAKQAGYSDEDIQLYLNTKNQPAAQDKPMNRYDEQVGTFTSAYPEAVKLGLEGAGIYGLYKGAQNIFGNKNAGPVVPAAQQAGQMGAQQAGQMGAQQAVNGPLVNNGPRVAPNLSVQQGGATGQVAQPMATPNIRTPQPSILDHAGNIVRKLALSKILPAAAMGMELFNTSPEEIDTLKKAEALKRAQGWKPLNER